MRLRRLTNPHHIAITHWQITHVAFTRAELRIDIDIPMTDAVMGADAMRELPTAICDYLDNRTKSRTRRIWEAITC